VQASRTIIRVGTAMLAVYLLVIGVYFSRQARRSGDVATADGPTQYVVTTPDGQTHLIDNVPDDPAAVLVEAGRRFGEVTSVKKLEPGDALPDSAGGAGSMVLLLAAAMLTFPLALIFVGFRARSRAENVRALWTAVAPTLTIASGPLQSRLGLDDRGLQETIERLNSEGRVQLVFDAKNKRVYDRRLSDHTITVQFCPRCNAAMNVRLIADLLQTPACPSCMSRVESADLDHLKAGIVQELRNDGGADAESDFSTGTFVALAILFPPGAIYYGINNA